VVAADDYRSRTRFALVVISLVTMVALLTGLLYLAFARAAAAEPKDQAYLLRLAWLTGAVLIATFLVLVGVIVHYVASRLSEPPEKYKPTGYVDIWSEAGRRLKPEDAPPVEPFELEDQEE
jgi:membrane protein implicated in regulation of membrane protease activity